MKKKAILFALSDLRSISDVPVLERDWDVSFSPNSEQAINALGHRDFEAIVTDIRPDPTFETPLMGRVLNRYPQVIRIMLLDPAAKTALKTDASVHQYLNKPAAPSVLTSAVERCRLISSWLKNPALTPLLVQMKKLPSVPVVHMKLMKQLQSPETGIDEIGKIIAQDFNLTARILQMVNSAAFGLSYTVSTPEDAVGYMGIERIKGLVLVASALANADSGKGSGLSVDELWQHSLAAAKMARAVAKAGGDAKSAEEAFTAGLLHDVGKLLLAVNLTEAYNGILTRSKAENLALETVEQEVLGVTHAEIGACVLGTWGLPSPIVAAIAFHHTPEQNSKGIFDTTTAVHIANAFVHGWTRGGRNTAGDKLDAQHLRELGITSQLDEWQAEFQQAA